MHFPASGPRQINVTQSIVVSLLGGDPQVFLQQPVFSWHVEQAAVPATPIIVRPAERCRDIEFAVLQSSEGSGKRRVQSGSEPGGVVELKLSRCRACKCACKHADSVRAKRLALPRLATSPW